MNESFLEATKPVRIAAVAALGFLALFLALKSFDVLAYGVGRSDTFPPKTVMVEGKGTVTAIPNIARISFSVTESEAGVADAQAAATAKTDAALMAVGKLGIEDKDVKTLSYNVYPKYDYGTPCYTGYCPPVEPRIVGYEVSQTIEVKVRDTAKAGDVLQALGETGVQNISGPNFTVDDDEALKADARAAAVADAKEKAKMLAKELGVSLGGVVSFYETNNQPYYDYGYYGKGGAEMAVAQSAPSLPTGETETEVTVSITYEIR